MRSRLLLLIPLLLTLLLMWAITPASALSGWQITSFNVTCEFFQVFYDSGTFDRDNSGSGAEIISGTITDGAGNIIHSFQSFVPVGITTAPSNTTLGFSPLPVANPIRLVMVSQAGNGFEEQLIWDVSGDCDQLPPSNPPPPTNNTAASFAGVGIPAGFVMQTIACTTPVYTEPGGIPVGEDRVLTGQTWYVDPIPVVGADGQQWTEIFVGSAINPWIPSECVGA